ncbi:MAG TPA: hypothetical protein VMZ71_13425, partial [Gemmataceae bacterium]|nr:hypothetical protein [Gemmataceae bacterium]
MAEPSRPPSLPSTADEVAYAPVSWLAVGSVAVAGLFVLSLIFFGLDAFRGKKSLIMPELLLLAGIAVVLSFAARRIIRTSEGTRTGEKLTNVAWWTAVVVGIVYGAYWLAIEYSIRRDAREEVQKWVGTVLKGETAQAFHRTLDPGRRSKIAANDEGKMMAEFRPDLIGFRQTDLLRLTARHPGECEFVPGGLRDWVTKPRSIECVFTGTVKCPEGSFPIHVPLKGTEGLPGAEGALGRQWQVTATPAGFFQLERVTMTRFGWYTRIIENQGSNFAKSFINLSSAGLGSQPYAYHAYVKPTGGEVWGKIAATGLQRAGVVGGLAVAAPLTPDYTKYLSGDILRLPNAAEPTLTQRTTFQNAWNSTGLLMPGARLKGSTDTNDFVKFVRDGQKKITSVEVSVPCELPMPISVSDSAVARARVVVECTDPAALEMLNQLRETAADPNQPLL